MVKSRRAASSSTLSEKATTARRPSVFTSRRKVVISCGAPPLTTVMVPWSIPVGIALRPAACASSITRSGCASVAMSISETGAPSSAFRTQPPTNSACAPAPVRVAQTFCVAGSETQPSEICVIHSPALPIPATSGPSRPRCNKDRTALRNNTFCDPASGAIQRYNSQG